MKYSVLNKQEISSILLEYGFLDISSYKTLSGGWENTNYFVATKTNKFVLTICEQKSVTEATQLAQLLEHLDESGFSTSKIVRDTQGRLISLYKNKAVLLKTFIKGIIIADIPAYLLELIGVELGKLHQIEAPKYIPKTISYGIERFNEVEAYALDSPFHKWLQNMQEYIEKHISPDLPKALIHSDVFCSNVIVDEEQQCVTIMDFEEATHYYRIFDIGMAIVGLCSSGVIVDLKKVGQLLKGYQKESTLLAVELKALQAFTVYAATAMCFWRHKNFNFVKPTPKLREHYKELKNIADYVKGIPAADFYSIIEI